MFEKRGVNVDSAATNNSASGLIRSSRNEYKKKSKCIPRSSLSHDHPMALSSPLLFLLSFFYFAGFVMVQSYTGTYGINYGRIADNILSPERVVKLLKVAKIKNVRIYDADHSVLKAFKGSGLELVVGLHNGLLSNMSSNEDHAMSWVRENVQSFLPETHICGIAVGNEVLGSGMREWEEALLGAVKNVYKAVDSLGLTDAIEISTSHSSAVFANSYPPSSCIFNDDVIQYMKPLLQFFFDIGSPFFLNAYPFLVYRDNPRDVNLNYALFQSNPGIYDNKTHLHYDNLLDAQIDAAYAALDAASFGKMEVQISETGWASKGDDDETGASLQNAKIYNFNLRKRLAIRKGTPMRPKIVLKAYVFALFNENLKDGKFSERNFGLYKPDGSIAYDIGFSPFKASASSLFDEIRGRGFLASHLMFLMMRAVVLFVL